MQFQTKVELGGKTATGMEVPAEIVAELDSGKRPAVRVAISGHTYRSTVASMGGRFMIPLSAEHRAAAGVTAGDVVTVELTLDTEPRTVEVPEDLGAALNAAPEARRAFDELSYSLQRRHVLSVTDAKTPETRRRRVARTIDSLLAG